MRIIPASHRLNEDVWFQLYQPMLLGMANTRIGRDILCIPQDFPKIVLFRKNCIHGLLGRDEYQAMLIADFRVGAKWGNVIRRRHQEFASLARNFLTGDRIHSAGVSPLARAVLLEHCSTLTAYPDPNPETTTVDGDTESATGGSFSALVNDAGDAATDSTANDVCVRLRRNDRMDRSFFGFDTSSLTSSASISAAVFSVRGTSKSASDVYTSSVCVDRGVPNSATAIVASDYNISHWASVKQNSSDITWSSFSTSAYSDFSLNATGLGNVSKTGVSWYGLRYVSDLTATDPGSGTADSYIFCDYADTAGTTTDPKLVVTYTVSTASPSFMLLGVGI